MPNDLAAAIDRACRPASRYWLHLHKLPDPEANHEIEIRIDVPLHIVSNLTEIPPWRVVRTRPDTGLVFLRRFQPLTHEAVKAMIADAITLAYRYGGQFHSWTHERRMLDWKHVNLRP
jgi:hypothetical protein